MMSMVLGALGPVVLLLCLGQWLSRRAFVEPAFWAQAERLCYFVLLPSLFVHGLASGSAGTTGGAGLLVIALVGSTVASALMVVALRPLMRLDGAAFTSVFQGGIRFNNYIGITLAVGLFGADGVALAAIATASIVPTVNVLCILVFARFGTSRLGIRQAMVQIATNPLIVASALGISLRLSGTGLPPVLEPTLRTLGAASLPLGLLCVGAALSFASLGRWIQPIAFATLAKFLAMPIMGAAAIALLGLEGNAAITTILFLALPTASSSYILARQLGGDAPLMAAITAAQTVIALVTIPATMALLTG